MGETATTKPRPGVSRRGFLRTAAAGAALAGAGLAAPVARAGPRATAADASLVPADPELHLLRRATYGPTPAALTEIRRLGRQAWLDRQLDPASIADDACDDLVGRFHRLDWTVTQAMRNLDSGSWDLMFDLGVATLARACWSKRQLLEVMVDFWSNHLNATNPSDEVWFSRHDYDRTVIRRHALGRFEDMLLASATHPAMLLYLDNAYSTKEDPNENYGRELLELHTVGVEAGYTEEDMRNSTLAMTGFGINWDTGTFKYWKWDHHVGPLRVMGWTHPNGTPAGGYDVGRAYLRYLARHPATARHIAAKLCLRFVSDSPPPGLVGTLAQTYLDNDTEIVPVLRKLFASTAFKGSLGAKVRRPLEDLVATVRILGIKPDATGVTGMQELYWMVESLGHAPMAWHPPNGYPDVAEAWRSAGGTLGRWNSHMSLAAHWWPEKLQRPPLRQLLPQELPATHGALVQALARRLLFRPLSTGHRNAVLRLIGKNAAAPLRKSDEAVKWRLPYLVSLLLDAPHFQIR